jgi:hypothetical protein
MAENATRADADKTMPSKNVIDLRMDLDVSYYGVCVRRPTPKTDVTQPEEVLLTKVAGEARYCTYDSGSQLSRKQPREKIRQTLFSAGGEPEHALLYL